MNADSSIAVTAKSIIDEYDAHFDTHRASLVSDFGAWVEGMQDSEKGTFLVHGLKAIMRDIFSWSCTSDTTKKKTHNPLWIY